MENNIREFTSCKIENAAERFLSEIALKKADPFEKEIIICAGKTMEQYLIKKAADIKGTAPNLEFFFPRNAINFILSTAGKLEFITRLDKDIMAWKIFRLLPELIKKTEYEPLYNYLNEIKENIEFRRFKLAQTIASVFDYYLMYRGEWLEAWQNNDTIDLHVNGGEIPENLLKHTLWQSDLWKHLTVETSHNIQFKRHSKLLQENRNEIKSKLPHRISVFGLSGLPPDFLEFILLLSKDIQIDFYHITPCREYFADTTKYLALDECRNFLLASWGIQGRDFQKMLLEADLLQGEELDPESDEFFTENQKFINALQFDIIRDRGTDSENGDFPAELKSATSSFSAQAFLEDDSFTVVSAYSRYREVEMLKNHITALLHNQNLTPDEIAVMAPNIEDYVPYIKAVFGTHENNINFHNRKDFIPYSIADCSNAKALTEAEIFIKILTLPDSRMTSEDIFEIISSEPLMHKLKITVDELNEIRNFIEKAHINWGMNKTHREKILKCPYPEQNTWQFGIDRIITGYALGDNKLTENEILPLNFTHNNGIAAGKLIKTVQELYSFTETASLPHSPDDWYKILKHIINNFFEIQDSVNENLLPLHDAVDTMKNNCDKADISEPFSIQVIKSTIASYLQNTNSVRKSFFRGNLTFCSLLPMRNIPFKAVCILGLNDGEFPRISSANGFDLAAACPKTGDRSLSAEDRFIFLEILLACRGSIYLSFVGKSKKDNERIPPSLILDELLDYISNAVNIDKNDIITEHPLYSFDARYFTNTRKKSISRYKQLYSYSKKDFEATGELLENSKENQPQSNIYTELPIPENRELVFSFDDFISFFKSPSAFFLNWRLNIRTAEREDGPLEITEPLLIDSLTEYSLKTELLETENTENEIRKLKAEGILPYNNWGNKAVKNAIDSIEQLRNFISEYGKPVILKEQFSFEVPIPKTEDKLSFTGTFKKLYTGGVQLFARPASIKFKDKLTAYFYHCLAAVNELDYKQTIIVTPKKVYLYQEITKEKALNFLTQAAEYFYLGLKRPLPLFINSSEEYTAIMSKRGNESEAIKSAAKKWEKSQFNHFCDLNDKANLICFGEEFPPLGDEDKENAVTTEFKMLADKIYYPPFVNLKELGDIK